MGECLPRLNSLLSFCRLAHHWPVLLSLRMCLIAKLCILRKSASSRALGGVSPRKLRVTACPSSARTSSGWVYSLPLSQCSMCSPSMFSHARGSSSFSTFSGGDPSPLVPHRAVWIRPLSTLPALYPQIQPPPTTNASRRRRRPATRQRRRQRGGPAFSRGGAPLATKNSLALHLLYFELSLRCNKAHLSRVSSLMVLFLRLLARLIFAVLVSVSFIFVLEVSVSLNDTPVKLSGMGLLIPARLAREERIHHMS
jgi:hypothetical protein